MWDLLPAAPLALVLAFAITVVSAMLQGTIGFGFAVLSVPVLSLIDPVLAPVPQLLVTLPMTLSMAWRERHALELRGATWVLLGRLPGAALGLLLLKLATSRTLDFIIAGCVLVAVVIVATGFRIDRNWRTELGAGTVSGIMGMVASIGGPPMALLYRDAAGPTLRSTLAVIFSVGLTLTIATRAIGGEIRESDLHVAVVLLPALLLGVWLSRFLTGKVEGRPLRAAILIVASLAALGLLIRAVVG